MLALIAGRGLLPAEVVAHAGGDILICAMAGSEPDQVQAELTFRLEQL